MPSAGDVVAESSGAATARQRDAVVWAALAA